MGWKEEYGIFPDKTVLVRVKNPFSGTKRNVNPKVAKLLRNFPVFKYYSDYEGK